MVKISEEGIGRLITKEKMKKDKVLLHNQCCMVFLKPEISHLDRKFFAVVTDSDLNDTTHTSFFNKDMDNQNKRRISMDDDVTTTSKSVTNIAEECEKGEASKSITIAETDVDENTSSKDIQVPETVTYRKSTKGAKYIPVKK